MKGNRDGTGDSGKGRKGQRGEEKGKKWKGKSKEIEERGNRPISPDCRAHSSKPAGRTDTRQMHNLLDTQAAPTKR